MIDLEPGLVVDVPAVWVCMVRRSGYHNGPGCTQDEPHSTWGCGWKFSLLLAAPAAGSLLRAHLVVRDA